MQKKKKILQDYPVIDSESDTVFWAGIIKIQVMFCNFTSTACNIDLVVILSYSSRGQQIQTWN